MNFKEYYQKHILKESPMRLGMSSDEILDNDALNQQEAFELIENGKPADQILLKDTVDLNLYRTEFESTVDYFVNKTPLITCYFVYKVLNNDMQMSGVWNRRMSKGTAFHLFFDYYLPKHNSITSDNKHTSQGENSWKRLIKEAEKRNNKIKVVISNNEEVEIDNAEQFWGRTLEFYNYKLRIYR
jgi:hypothetical protein